MKVWTVPLPMIAGRLVVCQLPGTRASLVSSRYLRPLAVGKAMTMLPPLRLISGRKALFASVASVPASHSASLVVPSPSKSKVAAVCAAVTVAGRVSQM